MFRVPALALATLACAAAAHASELPYAQDFQSPDGSPWPGPWFPGSVHVTTWDVQGGRARLNGHTSQVARMILPGFSATDVEVEATMEFEDVAHQGIGFYVRQNGGTLHEYLPFGQGYAVFLKGSWAWPEDLGLWREIDGAETQFAFGTNPIAGGLLDHVRYRVRYRVEQATAATTRLRAKVWPEASGEPAGWTVDVFDAEPMLQGTAGSFAIDIYNHAGTLPVYLDDVVIRALPLNADAGPPPAVRALALSAPRPNPASSAASVEVTLARADDVALAVVDAAGRVVARPFAGPLAAGHHTLALGGALRGLAPGVYALELRARGERAMRRLVVAR